MMSLPLEDVLPWDAAAGIPSMVLVMDSVGTDGRFLLHTMASQVLRSSRPTATSRIGTGAAAAAAAPSPFVGSSGGDSSISSAGRVLWLGCTPATDKHIASGLKKIGCDVSVTTAAVLPPSPSPPGRQRRLEIIPILQEMAASYISQDEANTSSSRSTNESDQLKAIYERIKSWLVDGIKDQSAQQQNIIIIDDASSLAAVVGQQLAELFIRQIRSLLLRHDSSSAITSSSSSKLAVLCSNDADQDRHLAEAGAAADGNINVDATAGGGKKGSWIGSAGDASMEMTLVTTSQLPWERSLAEIADGIIDVVPLQSGFSLEAHGRLVFTERKGGSGWKHQRFLRPRNAYSPNRSGAVGAVSSGGAGGRDFLTTVVNYVCGENVVQAFRLRSTT